MKKLLDLSEEVVKALTHEAVEKGTDFKNHVQTILIEKARKLRFYAQEGGRNN